ncbi:MAG: hypothetical protein WCL16_08850 [bacterium]
MIWATSQPDETAETLEPPVRKALTGNLDPRFSQAAPIEEIVHSVATWLHDHRRSFSDSPAAREELSLLAAQALHAVGHPLCARRMALVGSGLVRSSAWTFAAGATVWALDLAPLVRRPADRYELPFLVLLRTTLHQLASLWPDDNAQLVLGLRHLRPTVDVLLGPEAVRRKREQMTREICLFVTQAAQTYAARRVTCVILDTTKHSPLFKIKDARHDQRHPAT